jgi:hypothetical protein
MYYDQSNRTGYPTTGTFVGTGPNAWQTYGTELTSLSNYGLALGYVPQVPALGGITQYDPGSSSLTCPSSNNPVVMWSAQGSWEAFGTVIWSNYMYVGGLVPPDPSTGGVGRLAPTQLIQSECDWGTMVPAVRQSDANLSNAVLAADETYADWSGNPLASLVPTWTTLNGGLLYRVNHVDKTFATPRPAFQNILYGDGHVWALNSSDYPLGLQTGAFWTKESMTHLLFSPAFYWSGQNLASPQQPF